MIMIRNGYPIKDNALRLSSEVNYFGLDKATRREDTSFWNAPVGKGYNQGTPEDNSSNYACERSDSSEHAKNGCKL